MAFHPTPYIEYPFVIVNSFQGKIIDRRDIILFSFSTIYRIYSQYVNCPSSQLIRFLQFRQEIKQK